jgi:hypothetical protein
MGKAKPASIDLEARTAAVIRVGDGRGFIVEDKTIYRHRLVITAAHCLPGALDGKFPLAISTDHTAYQRLLAPLGGEPAVWAERSFVDPIADVAVLTGPDNQELGDEARAYDVLTGDVEPFAIAETWPQEFQHLELSNGRTLSTPEQTPGPVHVLSLANQWRSATAQRLLDKLLFMEASGNEDHLIQGGMSGSPILNADGAAIGLVSSTMARSLLLEALPRRLALGRKERRRPKRAEAPTAHEES